MSGIVATGAMPVHCSSSKCSPDSTRTFLGANQLMFPTGAAVDAAGAVYTSNFSTLPGRTPKKSPFKGAGGTLVKITP